MEKKLAGWFAIGSVLALCLVSCAANQTKPPLPCRTPKELKNALDYALNSNDTNCLWQLYAWTNVPPREEQFEKLIQLQFHPVLPDDWSSFYSFRIVTPPPADWQEILARTNPAKPHFNIPIQGVILCDQKMRKGSIRSRFEHMEFPFGQMPDGAYQIGVLIKGSGTNAAAKAP